MELKSKIEIAEKRRRELVNRLQAEGTDSWRLFHGVAEGHPGLTIDKYGPLILAQSFRKPLTESEIAFLTERYGDFLVYNHRGAKRERFAFHQPETVALEAVTARELGLEYHIEARHRGIDPYLFLDLRCGRRWLRDQVKGKTVLNVFAYTCGLGVVAASSGASEVWNVDFSASALEVGRKNFENNGLPLEPHRFLQEDYFAAVWQLSGIGVKGKRARRSFRKLSARQFDLVLLDPPARAKGSFHTVDLVNDYQSVFKPALLCCAPGGTILATNNVGSVEREEFAEVLLRCAEKAGRPLRALQWLVPDEDFPSFDGQPPLKVALCEVG